MSGRLTDGPRARSSSMESTRDHAQTHSCSPCLSSCASSSRSASKLKLFRSARASAQRSPVTPHGRMDAQRRATSRLFFSWATACTVLVRRGRVPGRARCTSVRGAAQLYWIYLGLWYTTNNKCARRCSSPARPSVRLPAGIAIARSLFLTEAFMPLAWAALGAIDCAFLLSVTICPLCKALLWPTRAHGSPHVCSIPRSRRSCSRPSSAGASCATAR
jgi:hypothetical protein